MKPSSTSVFIHLLYNFAGPAFVTWFIYDTIVLEIFQKVIHVVLCNNARIGSAGDVVGYIKPENL